MIKLTIVNTFFSHTLFRNITQSDIILRKTIEKINNLKFGRVESRKKPCLALLIATWPNWQFSNHLSFAKKRWPI